MVELNNVELLEIEGGKWSTFFTGLACVAGGIACKASSAVTVPMAVGGYALYNIGGLVMIGSMVDWLWKRWFLDYVLYALLLT